MLAKISGINIIKYMQRYIYTFIYNNNKYEQQEKSKT